MAIVGGRPVRGSNNHKPRSVKKTSSHGGMMLVPTNCDAVCSVQVVARAAPAAPKTYNQLRVGVNFDLEACLKAAEKAHINTNSPREFEHFLFNVYDASDSKTAPKRWAESEEGFVQVAFCHQVAQPEASAPAAPQQPALPPSGPSQQQSQTTMQQQGGPTYPSRSSNQHSASQQQQHGAYANNGGSQQQRGGIYPSSCSSKQGGSQQQQQQRGVRDNNGGGPQGFKQQARGAYDNNDSRQPGCGQQQRGVCGYNGGSQQGFGRQQRGGNGFTGRKCPW